MAAEPQAQPIVSWAGMCAWMHGADRPVRLHGHDMIVRVAETTFGERHDFSRLVVQPPDYRFRDVGSAICHYSPRTSAVEIHVYPASTRTQGPVTAVASPRLTMMEFVQCGISNNREFLLALLRKLTPEMVEVICGC